MNKKPFCDAKKTADKIKLNCEYAPMKELNFEFYNIQRAHVIRETAKLIITSLLDKNDLIKLNKNYE